MSIDKESMVKLAKAADIAALKSTFEKINNSSDKVDQKKKSLTDFVECLQHLKSAQCIDFCKYALPFLENNSAMKRIERLFKIELKNCFLSDEEFQKAAKIMTTI